MKKFQILFLLGFIVQLAFAQSETTMYKKGIDYCNSGEWAKAEQAFLHCLTIDNTDNSRKRDGAKYISYFPNRELGTVYIKLEKWDKAKKYLNTSLSHENTTRAHEKLALIPDNTKKTIKLADNKPVKKTTFTVYQNNDYVEVLKAFKKPEL